MNTQRKTMRRSGFTMVELMVVIAVIALLVAILMPALATIRTKAKGAGVTGQFRGLDTGIEAFRGESALGGRLPPSSSDDATDHQAIAYPQGDSDMVDMPVSGAHLLLQAMLGADLLGTPGFVDTDNNGYWSNDTHRGTIGANPPGAYALDSTTTLPLHARYGGAGYVDEKMKNSAKTINQLLGNGSIALWRDGNAGDPVAEQYLFVDPWDHPILYYRANRASNFMVGDPAGALPGIYRQEDNGIITGSDETGYTSAGMDFGAGMRNGRYHDISVIASAKPALVPTINLGVNDILTVHTTYEGSFARFIFDPTVLARNTPVRRDSYLLISAGPDGRYGTDDDFVNWTRDRK